MTDFARLLRTLSEHQVDYVVIGGVALVSHGHVRLTDDLDVCYARDPAKIAAGRAKDLIDLEAIRALRRLV